MRVEVVAYRREHLDAVIALCEEASVFEAFSYDRERAGRALEGRAFRLAPERRAGGRFGR